MPQATIGLTGLATMARTTALLDEFGDDGEVVAAAARSGVPTPALSPCLLHFDALRRERLPSALIQALRDSFGAHSYQRVDREGTFHTEWAAEGRPETPQH
jgi:6-phosphogluconate dehydrogenase